MITAIWITTFVFVILLILCLGAVGADMNRIRGAARAMGWSFAAAMVVLMVLLILACVQTVVEINHG